MSTHSNAIFPAEAVGFEPTGRSSRPTVFKTAAFDHSARPPKFRGGEGTRTPKPFYRPTVFKTVRLPIITHLQKELENYFRFTSTSFLFYITGEHIRLSINSSLYLG